MGWRIEYLEKQKKTSGHHFEVIREIVDLQKIHAETGKIYKVDPTSTKSLPRKYLPNRTLRIYLEMKQRFGIGNIVPYTDIQSMYPNILPFTLGLHILTPLWKAGYLNKYARGTYKGYIINPKMNNYTRGKHFGVHYEVAR